MGISSPKIKGNDMCSWSLVQQIKIVLLEASMWTENVKNNGNLSKHGSNSHYYYYYFIYWL